MAFTPYAEKMRELLSQGALTELAQWNGTSLAPLKSFASSGVSGSVSAYSSAQAEKIALGSITVQDQVQYGLCTIFPKPGLVQPVFFSVWDERAAQIAFLVDLMPTVDALVDEAFRKTYCEPLGPAWERFASLPGICPEEDDELRSACSIVYTAARVPIAKEGMRLAALAPHTEYLRSYLEFTKGGAPAADAAKNQELRRKTAALRTLLRAHVQEMLAGPVARALGADTTELMLVTFF